MRAYGLELRGRIVAAYQNGEGSLRDIAERFAVAVGTVCDYLALHRATGNLKPRPHGGGIPPLLDAHGLEHVRRLVQQSPDATEAELADDLARYHFIAVSRQTMGRALHLLGLTRKKNSSRDGARHRACPEPPARLCP
jgi:transposase